MTQIYISWRRQENQFWQTRLYDYLHSRYGNLVFQDTGSLPAGQSFREVMQERLSLCDVMLVVIGPHWLEARNPLGERSISAEYDVVRYEVALALSQKKKVIPVLLGETTLPRSTDLPADLSELAQKQPIRIHEQSWNEDIDHLIDIINETFASGGTQIFDDKKRGVFISYSHKDEEWKDRLVTQLSVLEAENLLQIWDDRKIHVGDNWKQRISDAMQGASIAVLLISADFLTSNFIRSEEVPKLLARQKQDGLRVVPLIVRPCAWKIVPWLAEIQVRPKDGRPLSSGNTNQIDQDLADLVIEIALLTA